MATLPKPSEDLSAAGLVRGSCRALQGPGGGITRRWSCLGAPRDASKNSNGQATCRLRKSLVQTLQSLCWRLWGRPAVAADDVRPPEARLVRRSLLKSFVCVRKREIKNKKTESPKHGGSPHPSVHSVSACLYLPPSPKSAPCSSF